MRYLGGCTECSTVWWSCRCPIRCEECACGYQPGGTCNTPGCGAGRRRLDAICERWAAEDAAEAETSAPVASIECQAVEAPQPAPEIAVDPNRPRELVPPVAGVQNGQAGPTSPARRSTAQRREEVAALLGQGLSDRAIARQARVSPSTVAAVRASRA